MVGQTLRGAWGGGGEPQGLALKSGSRRGGGIMRWFGGLAKAGVAITVFLLIGFAVDWRGSLGRLVGIGPGWIALATVLALAGLLLSAWRWERLLRVLGPGLGLYAALKVYWVGSLFNNVLPSTVGADVVRLALARKRVGLSHASASIAVERLTGLAMLLVVALLALAAPAAATMLDAHRWWLFAGLAAVLAAGVLAVALAPRLLGAGQARRHLRRFPHIVRLLDKGQGFAQALLAYRRNPGSLVVTLALSALFYAMLGVFQWALLHAVGAEIGLLQAAIAVPLVILVNLLPISINGLGVTEGAFILLYSRLGVPAEITLAAAILRRLVIVATSSVGLVYWYRLEVSGTRS
jgi:glycosyltransferase 2 family protein